MRIGVLTSSRADYGIYLPLLRKLQADPFFDLRLIVFGTHLSPLHGHTIDGIQKDGFVVDHKVDHIPASDTAEAISTSMAIASLKFSVIWQQEQRNYDLVICLGDRYEMFSAVSASRPFGIDFAHIHGGETSLGAIDNEFRHALTIFSALHFVSTEAYATRVKEIKGSPENIYTIGALSLDNLEGLDIMTDKEFREQFQISMDRPSILVTFHPETTKGQENAGFAVELVNALEHIQGYQIIITMPNADAMGQTMRQVYQEFAAKRPDVILVENFGTKGYFSCMKKARLVVGNSSSGIIEAASFNKYVVDVGDRQKGRARSANIIHAEISEASIWAACEEGLKKGEYTGANIYHRKNAAEAIIAVIKKWNR
jgi:GDP/UDP-N,N'-diacetylbacillosamine 2-epimerase (hydrolysing)